MDAVKGLSSTVNPRYSALPEEIENSFNMRDDVQEANLDESLIKAGTALKISTAPDRIESGRSGAIGEFLARVIRRK